MLDSDAGQFVKGLLGDTSFAHSFDGRLFYLSLGGDTINDLQIKKTLIVNSIVCFFVITIFNTKKEINRKDCDYYKTHREKSIVIFSDKTFIKIYT